MDQSSVSFQISFLQVVQHVSSLTYHLQQTSSGVMVLLVFLQMFVQVVDSVGQNCDLNFGGTGVAFVGSVLLHNSGFLFG